jgi:hypothetical protein
MGVASGRNLTIHDFYVNFKKYFKNFKIISNKISILEIGEPDGGASFGCVSIIGRTPQLMSEHMTPIDRANGLALLLLMVVGTTSCKTVRTASSEIQALNLRLEHIESSLMSRVFEPEYRLCVVSKLEGEARSTFKDQVDSAIQKWLEPLKSLTSQPVNTNVNFMDVDHLEACANHAVHLTIEHKTDQRGRAHYVPSEQIIRLFEGDSFGVLLHELGHAFGLADTYDEDRKGCVAGHPRSLMCPFALWGARYPESLYQDDVIGIQNSFCSLYRAITPKCAEIQKLGPTENLDSDGAPFYKLGIEVTGGQTYCPDKAQITSIDSSGPAAKWGLKKGDCISSVNDVKVTDSTSLFGALKLAHSSLLSMWVFSKESGNHHRYILAAAPTDAELVPESFALTYVKVPLYSGSDRDKPVGGSINKNEIVRVLEVDQDWLRIRLGFSVYWVKRNTFAAIHFRS